MASFKEFEKWWIETEPRLLHTARQYTSSLEDAQDVVQQIAVVAIKKLDSFGSIEEFRGWAYSRARWRAIDQLRKSIRHEPLEASVELGTNPIQEQSVIIADVLQLVAQLPRRQQEVMTSIIEGQTDSQIAKKLQITEPSVRSLKRFARAKLTTLLSTMEGGDHNG